MRLFTSAILLASILGITHAKADTLIIGSPLTRGTFPTTSGELPIPTEGVSPPSTGNPLLDNFGEAIRQAGRAAGAKMAFKIKLDAARQEFFALYPEKPGIEVARERLADLLVQVDIYYLTMYLQEGMTDAAVKNVEAIDRLTGGPFGYGIHPEARDAFQNWVRLARSAMGATPPNLSVGQINAFTGKPIPSGPTTLNPECTRPVIVCSETKFIPTNDGFVAGLRQTKDAYAYYVAWRDRAEVSSATHVPISSLAPISERIVTQPPSSTLSNQQIVPYFEAALGQNNQRAATSGGELMEGGVSKLAVYQQVAASILAARKYKLLECSYGPNAVYHFWSDAVPPNFSQLTALVSGPSHGDAVKLGTRPVDKCPADEDSAKNLQRDLALRLDRPNPMATPPIQSIIFMDHTTVGAISPKSNTYGPNENSVPRAKASQFIADVDEAMAEHQQVLKCTYLAFGISNNDHYYWYKKSPSNVASLVHGTSMGNGVLVHMGTRSFDACPSSLQDERSLESPLFQESQKYVDYKYYQ